MSMKVGETISTVASSRSLHDTPTWALAAVSFAFISISILMEHYIHVLGRWLKRHHKKALSDALEKLKSELMLLGFISLLLAVTERPITKICIPTKVADTMLPCRKSSSVLTSTTTTTTTKMTQLLEPDYEDTWRSTSEAQLAAASSSSNNGSSTAAASDYCSSKGMVSLISEEGLGQLSIFIFVLALMHVIYSVLTMALGKAKMRRWKAWEKETQSLEYEISHDPNRFRYTRDTTFGRRHMNSWIEASYFLWIKCFFRQFFNSVPKVDYLTLRHGFISTHHMSTTTFNFQKYIERSLEDDFKIVVGISPALWFIVVIFLLFNVHGLQFYLWIALVPLIIVLALGAKLEVIVARMAIKLKNQNTVIRGSPLVEPNDELFWFGHPKFLLHFIHLTLFMNAYELAYFVWITFEFGFKSCYHDNTVIISIRIVLAVTVQVICSYVTLPLYALVTQMGSQFKSAVLEEQTARVLKDWHANVRAKRKKQPRNQPQDESNSPSNSQLKVDSNETITQTQQTARVLKDWHANVRAKRKKQPRNQPQDESNSPSNSQLKVDSNETITQTHVSSPADQSDHPSCSVSTSTFDEIVLVDPHEERNQK